MALHGGTKETFVARTASFKIGTSSRQSFWLRALVHAQSILVHDPSVLSSPYQNYGSAASIHPSF